MAGLREARERMLRVDLIGRGIKDRRVLEAMRKVERERFVGGAYRDLAYSANPSCGPPYLYHKSSILGTHPTDEFIEPQYPAPAGIEC